MIKVKAFLIGMLALAASFLATPAALAGSSCQYITTGAVLTAAQWNSCFQAKQNELGYTPINKAGDGMTGLLTTIAPTASTAGFRLYPGVAPTSPTNGDLWTTSSGLYVRINGATVGPLRDSSSGSFAGTSPITVSFPASVVTYAFDFTVANSWLATQTMRTILAGTTNTYDIGTSASAAAFRTIYAGTSFVGPIGTFTTSVAAGGCTIGSDALCVTGTTTHTGAVTVSGGSLTMSGNQSAAAWTTTGIRYRGVAGTLTDTTSSGTVAAAYTNVFGGGSTIAALSAVTFTNYFGSYFNDPVQGTNVTFTNKWALGADSAKFGTSNQLTISTAGVLTATSPVFTTPTLGVAAGTSLALGGCTISTNALCATGTANISGATTIGGALTYGGVTLSNAVTGTGNMVLSASPTFSGSPVLGTPTATTLNGNTFTTGTYTLTGVAGKTLTFNKSITLEGTDSTTMTFPSVSASLAALTIEDQTLSGGANVTAKSQSTGNITIDCGARPLQYITNDGAYTITAPASDGSCMLFVTNGASAGATTFSGFTVGGSTGGALTTTNGNKFTIQIWRINGTAAYMIFAHQ